MAVTHKKTVNFSGVAGAGQANYDWQDPSTNWITWPPTQVGSTNEWEFVVASNSGAQRQATIEVRHWDYVNDNSLTDSFTITQEAAPSVPTYTSLSGAPDPANEGQVVTFTVQGTDLSAGTVPYTLSGNGIDANDINGGVLSGNITMANTTGNNWEGTLTVTLTNDQTTEGTENLICSLGANDSNGVATGGFTTNVQVNDTSTQPSTVNVNLQWFESTATLASWQVSGSSVLSGAATNVTANAVGVTFDAAPGEVMQFTITGSTNGTDFTSIGGNDIITISSQSAGGSLVSNLETLIDPDSISFVYQYTVPAANTTVGVTFAAETIVDSGNNGNNQIWVTAGVDNPSTNTSTGGTGQMPYTLDRNSNNPQSFLVDVKLDPDGTLADSGANPEVYFASDAAGTQSTSPWFVSVNNINNGHTDSNGATAEIAFTEGIVTGNTPGGYTPAPGNNLSSNSQYGGSPGAETMAGPQPPSGSNNQCYIIIKHPADPTNYVSIDYTGSSQVTTTTQAPVTTYTFEWTTGGNNTVSLPASQSNPATATLGGVNRFDFTWDGPTLSGGNAANSDFNWPNWNGMAPGATCTVYNMNDTAHSGGDGYVHFGWQDDGTGVSLQTNATGVTFDGNGSNGSGPYTLDSSSVLTSGYIQVAATNCHVTGTVMNLADGSTKLVEELQVGDVLKSYTIQGLGEDENQQPWQTYSSQINQWSATETTAEVKSVLSSSWSKYVNINNGLTKVTDEHPVLIKGAGNDISFKAVKDVVVGDSLYVNGAWVEVTSLEEVNENITAYKIDVESADVYLADGILWHNVENEIKN